MSGQKRKKVNRKKGQSWYESAWLTGLLLLTVAIYLGLSISGGTGPWWLLISGDDPGDLITGNNPGGPVGSAMSTVLHVIFGGLWCWLFPLVLAGLGLGYLTGKTHTLRSWMLRAIPFWLVTTAWIAQPGGPFAADTGTRLGGIAGYYIAHGFHGLFGLWGGRIFLTLFLLIAGILVFKPWLGWLPEVAKKTLSVMVWPVLQILNLGKSLAEIPSDIVASLKQLFERKKKQHEEASVVRKSAMEVGEEPDVDHGTTAAQRKERTVHNQAKAELEDAAESVPEADSIHSDGIVPETLELPGATGEFVGNGADTHSNAAPVKITVNKKSKPKKHGPMILPEISLLTPAGPEGQSISAAELDIAADLLENTLRSFGVEGEVKDVRPGPVVTTFEYQPGSGVRVNQIVQRADDMALAMRARSIRMEAPIPGKAAVGIEIPNPTARMVRLREVLEGLGKEKRTPLSVVLGKDVVGRSVSIDLASLPHLLVAGSTGSGKSVCLNAIISNLLLCNDPSTLRLCLIDPKMLEMNVYNGIPHLLLPVVTDPREALKALQWMVAQMEHRYRKLARCSVRNIQQYNDKIVKGEVVDQEGQKVTEPMPYYLTVVDELADLMMQLGNDIEGPITRLAQKARAVGIHLILATQRPSVDVLTGVIKANIPCRIAFRVIQKNDSRTVLDMNGAEQLLGHGDMLYLQPGRALPVRVHGSFIDVDECEAIAAHWRNYQGYTEEISLAENPSGGGMVTGSDDLYEDAKKIIVLHQSGSTSLLQRRLRIGYTRAGRIMDMLEEAGVVGPFTGSKARDVLISPEDLPEEGEGQA